MKLMELISKLEQLKGSDLEQEVVVELYDGVTDYRYTTDIDGVSLMESRDDVLIQITWSTDELDS